MINVRYVLCKNLANKYKRNITDKKYNLYSNNLYKNIYIPSISHTRKIHTQNIQDANSIKKRKKKNSFKNAFFIALLLYGSYESLNLYEKNELVKRKIETYPYLCDIIEKKIIPFKIDFDKILEKSQAHIKLHLKDVQSIDEFYFLMKCMILKIYSSSNDFIATKINNLLKMFNKGILKSKDDFKNIENSDNFKKYEIQSNIYGYNNTKETEMDKIHKINSSDINTDNEIDTLNDNVKNNCELFKILNGFEIGQDGEKAKDSNNEIDTNSRSINGNQDFNSFLNPIEKELIIEKNLQNEETKETLYENIREEVKENILECKLEKRSNYENRNGIENKICEDSHEKLIEDDQNKTIIEPLDMNNDNTLVSLDDKKEIDEVNKKNLESFNDIISEEKNTNYSSHVKKGCSEDDIECLKKYEEELKNIVTKEIINNLINCGTPNENSMKEDTYNVKFVNITDEKEASEGDTKEKNSNDLRENYSLNSVYYEKNIEKETDHNNMLKEKRKNNNNLKCNLSVNRINEGDESIENLFNDMYVKSSFEKNVKDFENKINKLNEKELKNKIIEMFINDVISKKYKDILMEEEKEELKKLLTLKYNDMFLKRKKKLQRDLKKNMIKKLRKEEKILKANCEMEKKTFENSLLNMKKEEIDKEKKEIENKLKSIEENYLKKMNIYACDINMMKDKFSKDQIKNMNLENIIDIQNQLVNLQNCLIHDLSIEPILPELKKYLEKDIFLDKVLKVLPHDFFSHKFKPTNNNEKIKNEFYNLYKESVKEAFLNENDNYLKKKLKEIMSYVYINYESTLNYIFLRSIKNSILKENLLNLSCALHSIEQNKLIDALKYINELKGNCKKNFFSFNEQIKNTILFKFYLRLAVSRLMLTSTTVKTNQ